MKLIRNNNVEFRGAQVKKAIGRIYIIIIMLFLYLPILTLIVLSFNETKSMSVWGGFSLHWY